MKLWFIMGICLIIETINYLLAYKAIFEAEIGLNKINVGASLFILLAYECIMMPNVGLEATDTLSMIPLLVVVLLLVKERKRVVLALFPIISVGTAVISTCFSFQVAMLCGISEIDLVRRYDLFAVWRLPTMFLLLFFYFYQKRKINNDFKIKIGIRQYIAFYLGIGCSYAIMVCMQMLSNGELSKTAKNAYGIATSLMCILFIFFGLWQGVIVSRESIYKKQNEMYEFYLQQQNVKIQEIIVHDESMRRFRHDLNAHLTAIQSLLNESNEQKLQEYMNEIIIHSAIYERKNYTNNSTIDAICRYYDEEAKGKGIEMKISSVSIAGMELSEFHMCTILSNLFKNAIEACDILVREENKWIELKMTNYENHLVIHMQNPVEKEVIIENQEIKSTKKNQKIHGFGLVNMRTAVNRLGGVMQIHCKNHIFAIDIII